MSAAFPMYAGDTKKLHVTVRDASRLAIDLTGASVRWQLSALPRDGTPIISKSVGSGIEIVDPEDGEFVVTLEPADTEELPPATYYHEAEVILADGTVGTVVKGAVEIKGTIIKPA